MDSGAPPASCSRCGGPKVFGGPAFARPAGKWSSLTRGRSRTGKNAHGQNNGGMHSNRLSKIAIHSRSFTGGFDRDAHLQPAHGRVHDKAWTDFLQFDTG